MQNRSAMNESHVPVKACIVWMMKINIEFLQKTVTYEHLIFHLYVINREEHDVYNAATCGRLERHMRDQSNDKHKGKFLYIHMVPMITEGM